MLRERQGQGDGKNKRTTGSIYQIEERSSQLLRNLSSCQKKTCKKKKSSLNGIRTLDLCDAGVVLYQLSYQLGAGHIVSS